MMINNLGRHKLGRMGIDEFAEQTRGLETHYTKIPLWKKKSQGIFILVGLPVSFFRRRP
jgi:hypothetical protein